MTKEDRRAKHRLEMGQRRYRQWFRKPGFESSSVIRRRAGDIARKKLMEKMAAKKAVAGAKP